MALTPLIVERYVLRRAALTILGVLVLLTAIIVLINFVALSQDVGQRADVPFFDLLGLAGLQTPGVMLVLLPFVFLFGTLGAYVNLNRRSELVAMRAAGFSAWRFITPVGVAAFLTGVLVFTAIDPLAATLERQFQDARERVAERADRAASGTTATDAAPRQPDRVWVRQGDRRTQVVIGARPTVAGSGVSLSEVTVLFYAVDARGTPQFNRRIDAPAATLQNGRWILREARDVTPGSAAARPVTLSLPATEQARVAFAGQGRSDRVPFWSLPAAIERAEDAGLSSVDHQLRFWQLLATPLMLAGMAVLAAASSLRLLRLGNLAVLAGAGVAVGFVFFFVNDLVGALGRAGYITPLAAAWTPPALLLLSGLTLLCYTEDG